MFKRLLFLTILSISALNTFAQDDFCHAIGAILHDAPNQFRNVRSPLPDKTQGSTMYKSQIKVPGTIISRFISAMGFFYEGALKQAKAPEALTEDYEKYQSILNDCLASKGYVMRQVPNHNHGLERYKKTLFMPDFKAGGEPPTGHIAMEIDFNKLSGMYTIILYIYEK